jgi:hypothetical protein
MSCHDSGFDSSNAAWENRKSERTTVNLARRSTPLVRQAGLHLENAALGATAAALATTLANLIGKSDPRRGLS